MATINKLIKSKKKTYLKTDLLNFEPFENKEPLNWQVWSSKCAVLDVAKTLFVHTKQLFLWTKQ